MNYLMLILNVGRGLRFEVSVAETAAVAQGRCDVSRLPFKTDALDGVHAGAALHCWTRLEEALSEVHRVLKPGKGFFATTLT